MIEDSSSTQTATVSTPARTIITVHVNRLHLHKQHMHRRKNITRTYWKCQVCVEHCPRLFRRVCCESLDAKIFGEGRRFEPIANQQEFSYIDGSLRYHCLNMGNDMELHPLLNYF